ncbi:MAG: prepilin-type N-terminal cleavage/methylation domain-containing protein [Planctomycetota bacterium]|jgi:prepilin-type N-terminal cleavage/methylation domain-containing protein|nr:prepilin-type N-terminal cleavage/methylation domain-containing protein [Planctomycetota bacterium]
MKNDHSASRRGFTLVELSLVVAIIMVLATIALPNFDSTVADAQVASVESQLARLRTAADFYSFQHDEQIPGLDFASGNWYQATLLAQLQMASDANGDTAAVGTAGYPFGPYLRDNLPANPFNELNTIMMIQPGVTFASPDNTTGWVYWADTGAIKINSTVVTTGGVVLFNL